MKLLYLNFVGFIYLWFFLFLYGNNFVKFFFYRILSWFVFDVGKSRNFVGINKIELMLDIFDDFFKVMVILKSFFL